MVPFPKDQTLIGVAETYDFIVPASKFQPASNDSVVVMKKYSMEKGGMEHPKMRNNKMKMAPYPQR